MHQLSRFLHELVRTVRVGSADRGRAVRTALLLVVATVCAVGLFAAVGWLLTTVGLPVA